MSAPLTHKVMDTAPFTLEITQDAPGGKLEVTAKTATENVIGANVTATGVSVIPPTWLQRHNNQITDSRP